MKCFLYEITFFMWYQVFERESLFGVFFFSAFFLPRISRGGDYENEKFLIIKTFFSLRGPLLCICNS